MLTLPLVRPKSQLLTSSVMAARGAMGESLMPNTSMATTTEKVAPLSWADVVGERTEGEPFYEIRRYDFFEPPTQLSTSSTDSTTATTTTKSVSSGGGGKLCFSIPVACFDQLPLCDAVGLLSGDDQTGLMVWEGSVLLTQWLLHAVMNNNNSNNNGTAAESNSLFGNGSDTKVIELGGGCGVVSAALARMMRVYGPFSPSMYDTVYSQIMGTTVPHVEKSESTDHTTTMQKVHRTNYTNTTTIIATDKNDECVYLSARNLRLEERVNGNSIGSIGNVSLVKSSADTYDWGASIEDARRLVHGKGVAKNGDITEDNTTTTSTKLVIIAGDVIYCREAVPPLVQAIQHLGQVSTTTTSPSSSSPVLFILSWMPRSMTVGETIYLLSFLLSSAVTTTSTTNNTSPTTTATTPSSSSLSSAVRVSLVYGAVHMDAPWEGVNRTLPPATLQLIPQQDLNTMVEDARVFEPTLGLNKEASSSAAEKLLGRCATKGCVLGFTIVRN